MRASVCCASSLTAHKNSSETYTITSTKYLPVLWLFTFPTIVVHVIIGPSSVGWALVFKIQCTHFFASRKVKLHRNVASMLAMVSFDRCLDNKILNVNFSFYANTHGTFCAEHNDCVHPAYFSFCTSVLRV